MLDDAHFHAIAAATLVHISDQLEQAYDNGDLDELDYDEGAGILSIITADGRTFILSKHSPSHQLWLASPLSGGLHFEYHTAKACWCLSDGRTLNDILMADLKKCAGVQAVL